MKALIERAWIRAPESGGITRYEVLVRIDVSKGKFIESTHRTYEDARARIEELLEYDTTVERNALTPTR